MKNTFNYIYILFCSLWLASCGDKVSEFPESIDIFGTPVKDITFYTKGNVGMLALDSILILQKTNQTVLQIYNTKNNFDLIKEYGSLGMGPSEFSEPVLMNYSLQKTDGKIIGIYDYNKRKYSNINLNHLLSNKENVQSTESIYEIDDYLLYFHYKDDSILVATPESSHRFVIFNYGEMNWGAKYIDYLPNIEKNVNNQLKSAIYRSATSVNKERKLIVTAPIFLGQIDFFNFQGEYLKSTFFESQDKLKVEDLNGSKRHIIALESKGDFIYALSQDNVYEDLIHQDKSKRNYHKIYVFDWDGKPVKQYVIADNRRIKSFTYDEVANKIYGYCPEEEEFNIVVYDLNKV